MQTEQRPDAAGNGSLQTRMGRHLVRFTDVQPDWRVFTPTKQPGNDRAVFQYVGPNGHGAMDPWALPAAHFGIYLLYVPPNGGSPYHTHEQEEVFTVLEGRMTFYWEANGEEAQVVLGPKDLVYCPANQRLKFVNAGVEGCWLHVALGGAEAPPRYETSG